MLKSILPFLVISIAASGQVPGSPRVVTFDRADTEHCKVAVAGGKPLLVTTFEGTTVAITMPQNWGNGEFSVFVSIAKVGAGEAKVNPKEITAIYPDADHSRFLWFDKARDLDTLASMRSSGLGQPPGGVGGPPGSGAVGQSSSASPPPNHPEAMVGADPDAHTRSEEESRELALRNGAKNGPAPAQLDPDHPPAFLRRAAVKQGMKAEGYVFLRRPKGAKASAPAVGTLDEIDIPINGVVFRF